MKKFCLGVLLAVFAGSVQGADMSTYINVDTLMYSCRDIAVDGAHGGFSVSGGTLHYWNPTTGYSTTDVATGESANYGLPEGGVKSNTYGDPFGCYDNATGLFYAATLDNVSDPYFYLYDTNTNEWLDGGSAVNAYAADCYDGQLYFTGLNEPWNSCCN